MVKTNRQIAEECAQAAWSWLCEQYDMPIPRIQEVIRSHYYNQHTIEMPPYRVSMNHRKGFSVPGIPGSTTGEVVISGTSLIWLPRCRTNNTIESWTLQFVEQFTRTIELRKQWEKEHLPAELTLQSTLNKIDFARLFFPHLYRKDRPTITMMRRKTMTDLKKIRKQRPVVHQQ